MVNPSKPNKDYSNPNFKDMFLFTVPIEITEELLKLLRRRYVIDVYVKRVEEKRKVSEIWARSSKHTNFAIREFTNGYLVAKGIL